MQNLLRTISPLERGQEERPYGNMAECLEEAWKDLNEQLEGRRILLDTSVAFHHSVQQVCPFSERLQLQGLIVPSPTKI